MITIQYSDQIRKTIPNVTLGVIESTLQIAPAPPSLDQAIEDAAKEIVSVLSIEDLTSNRQISATRNAYKAAGKNPGRYRASAEALVRRVLQEKPLPSINNLVDCNNLISLITLMPVGSYNLDRITAPIVFDIGQPGESYPGIGKGDVNLENMPLLRDNEGPFGSPTSDSLRALIEDNAEKVITILFSFAGADGFESKLEQSAQLIQQHCQATVDDWQIIRQEDIS